MPFVFANPWGLLALLGIPVVLAIHFLHRHRRSISISTLFLLEIAREPARAGRRWHRLIPSVPMWLQLLLVLLLAALLAQPRLPSATLRVAVVLDDSASMRAFRSELAGGLADLDRATRAGGRNVEWLVLSANPARARIFAGDNPAEWIARLGTWAPVESWRDPAPALRLARERVGPDGLVVYATDTPRENLPSGAALLSVGRELANAGIAGVSVTDETDGPRWQAVLVNPSAEPATRTWTLEWNGGAATPAAAINIPAGGMTTLEGPLPENATRLVLRLSSDDFALDDVFPFVRLVPKPLAMAAFGEGVPPWLVERMKRAVPRLDTAPLAAADFALIAMADESAPPPVAGIVFSTAGEAKAPYLSETPVAAPHPLTRGLAWSGLAVRDVPAPPPVPGDTVLLWSGARPLISLRTAAPPTAAAPDAGEAGDTETAPSPPPGPAGPQLVLHFNPTLSNLDRWPAAAILLLRFSESLRDAKAATAWEQLEPGQPLAAFLPAAPSCPLLAESLAADGTTITSAPLAAAARAPEDPGFLRVRDDRVVWLEAAVAFADPRESDFRERAPADTTAAALAAAVRSNISKDDAARPLLALATLAALLALYHLSAPKQDPVAGGLRPPISP